MTVVGPAGERRTLCESASGLVLGSIKLETEFVMHSFDERRVKDALLEGRKLVEEIRNRGESVKVDLGCGFRKTGNLGIDVTSDRTDADLICRLGFEPIPLADESADSVYCRDFLEHIPKAYYSESEKKLRYPVIELMNEVWRILIRRHVYQSNAVLSKSGGGPRPDTSKRLDAGEHAILLREISCGGNLWY